MSGEIEGLMDEGKKLWWLSFVGDEGFLGVVIVEADDFLDAVMMSHHFDINPGGQVQGWPVPPENVADVPPDHIGRLLSRADLDAVEALDAKSIEEFEAEDAAKASAS